MTLRKTTLFPFLCLLLLVLCCAHAVAEDDDDEDAGNTSTAVEATGTHEVRWYQVELLVFRQKPNASSIDEVWPKDISLDYPAQMETLKTPAEYEALTQKPATAGTPFVLLDRSHLTLDGFARNLRANHNDILLHVAWKQPLAQHLDQKRETYGTNIAIHGGERYGNHDELEGSIRLSLQKYLHVDTNLWLVHFVPADVDGKDVAGWPALPANPAYGGDPSADSAFRVDQIVTDRQTRRMRSRETHYIDHPKLGIAIRFIPLDAPSAAAAPRKKK